MKPETQKELSESGYDVMPISAEKREQLAQNLTKEEYDVLLNQGTEAPFCGSLLDNKKAGIYACRLCGLPLFDSKSKFTSGTGWASFYEPFDDEHKRNCPNRAMTLRRSAQKNANNWQRI